MLILNGVAVTPNHPDLDWNERVWDICNARGSADVSAQRCEGARRTNSNQLGCCLVEAQTHCYCITMRRSNGPNAIRSQ